MSMYECPKCGGVPGITACCTDQKKAVNMTEREKFDAWSKNNDLDTNPRYWTREYACWHAWQAALAQPAQAVPVLTDAEIGDLLDAARVPELPHGYEDVDLRIARAVEAAVRAKMGAAVPMTDAEIEDILWNHTPPSECRDFRAGFRAAERHHGIVGKDGGNV